MSDSSPLILELSLPSIQDGILESFSGFKYRYELHNNLSSILKPQWLKFNDIEWSYLYYFFKEEPGEIHTDLPSKFLKLKKIPLALLPWGINWIWGGNSLVEFWDFQDVESMKSFHISSANINKSVYMYSTTISPKYTYMLEDGKCYLVFNRLPHRFTGLGPRHSISLRQQSILNRYEDVVQKFKPYIVS